MRQDKRLPEVGVMRLSLYVRELARWEREGRVYASSAVYDELRAMAPDKVALYPFALEKSSELLLRDIAGRRH